MNVLLSDEQIAREIEFVLNNNNLSFESLANSLCKSVAQSQLKAVISWLEEPCIEHPDLPSKSKGAPRIFLGGPRHRYLCFDCWQQMKRGAGC